MDYRIEVGRLYSTGLDYDVAQKQFLNEASKDSTYSNNLAEEFENAWLEYEHMRFSAMQFMKSKE